MIGGLIVRSVVKEKKYRQHKKAHKSVVCNFCNLVESDDNQIIEQTKHHTIIKNQFSYDLWDGCGVTEHLLIIPKRHVTSLAELYKDELADYLNQVVRFEAKNYSVYARAPGNGTKSVAHQHTHLIKIDNKPRKFLVYLSKPYFLWSK